MLSKKGKFFIISAPSGAGKTTIINRIIETLPFLEKTVSYTTRKKRLGEKDKISYNFISLEEFQSLKEKNLLAEYAKVHDNYYGTSIKYIEEELKKGKILIKDIDVQGTKILKEKFPELVTTIFIKVSNDSELKKRLVNRKTDSQETINQRIENAKIEMEILEKTNVYDYTVLNDNLKSAVEKIKQIILKEVKNNG
jgi:guanylate kinase